nr:Fe-S cluster assembly protein HesB [uncultured Actinotalea sp.]
MLTLTDNARHAVQDIATRAGLPDDGGLRIAKSQQESGSFELSLVPAPADGDQVIETEGTRVFVESETSEVLADQQLDAAASPEGVGFMLAPQG